MLRHYFTGLLLLPLFLTSYVLPLTSYGQSYQTGELLVTFDQQLSEQEMTSMLESFDLQINTVYRELDIMLINVPCGEEQRWINILSHINGIIGAELNEIIQLSDPEQAVQSDPIGLCQLNYGEANYHSDTELLEIPMLYIDGGDQYRVHLAPPFNIRDAELIGRTNGN